MSSVCDKETSQRDAKAINANNPPASQSNQVSTGDPVNVVTGAFTLDEVDVLLPSQRLVLSVIRHYDSSAHNQATRPSPFGWGWTHSLNLFLEPGSEAHSYCYVDDRGVKLLFKTDSVSGNFISPAGGLGLQLIRLENGTFRLRQVDGLLAEFNSDGRITAMLRPGPQQDSQLRFDYDPFQRLVEASGANGRTLRFFYEKDSPLIRSIRDHTDREWHYSYDRFDRLIRVLDPARRIRRYEYLHERVKVTAPLHDIDITDGDVSVVSREINGLTKVFAYQLASQLGTPPIEVTNRYTSDYRVYEQIDALGNVTAFDYNRFTRVTAVTDPAGWTTIYAYDEMGNTTKIRKPEGGTTEYIYDERRNLIAEIDPLGYRTEYAELRDPSLFEREWEYGRRPLGNRSDYVTVPIDGFVISYDEFGNRPLQRNALGETHRYLDYNEFGRPTRIQMPNGDEVKITYEPRSGLPLRMERPLREGLAEPLHWIQEWRYDPWGNMTFNTEWAENRQGITDTRQVIEQEFDREGNQLLRRREWIDDGNADNSFPSEEHFVWNDRGELTHRTILRRTVPELQAEHLTTRYGYDILGRLIWEIAPDTTATYLERDLVGRVTETYLIANARAEQLPNVAVDKRHFRRFWQYDAMGRLLKQIDSSGATTVHEWDSQGLCIRSTEPTGFWVLYEYDRDGRETKRQTSSGYELVSTYDQAGRRLVQSDNAGLEIRNEYDAIGRVVSRTQQCAEGVGKTQFSFGTMGRKVTTQHPDGSVEQYSLDERGKPLQRAYGLGTRVVEETVRDGLGRVREVWVGNNNNKRRQFRFQYDDKQRIIETYDALGNRSLRCFDTEGNVIREVDGEGRTTNFFYDAGGRAIRRHATDESVHALFHYDFAGQLIHAIEGDVSSGWDYDLTGRVTRHQQRVGDKEYTVTYAYDSEGRLLRKEAGDLWSMTFAYAPGSPFVTHMDVSGRLLHLDNDPQGRVTTERWDDGRVTHYQYAPDGLLTSLQSRDTQNQHIFSQYFTHDVRRRPLTENRVYGEEETHYRYTYDDLDRLTRVEKGQASFLNEFRRYQYDDLGNRLSEFRDGAPFSTWRYDEANRLIQANSAGGKVEQHEYDRCSNLVQKGNLQFAYDAGQRLRKVSTVSDKNEVQSSVQYAYSALDQRTITSRPIGDDVAVYDGLNTILIQTPTQTTGAFWSFQPDGMLAQTNSSVRVPESILTDAFGSIIYTHPGEGFFDYDPFGNLISRQDAPPLFGFAGKHFDRESGLYYNRARQYDPRVGRFTQPDPMGLIDGLNPFVYARNNPQIYSDILGFDSSKTSTGRIARLIEPGHLVDRHVGKTIDFLRHRLATSNISAASTFTNMKVAKYVIGRALSSNDSTIDTWLAKGGAKLVIRYSGTKSIGVVLERGSSEPSDSSDAVLVLLRNEKIAEGYHIETGYPIP